MQPLVDLLHLLPNLVPGRGCALPFRFFLSLAQNLQNYLLLRSRKTQYLFQIFDFISKSSINFRGNQTLSENFLPIYKMKPTPDFEWELSFYKFSGYLEIFEFGLPTNWHTIFMVKNRRKNLETRMLCFSKTIVLCLHRSSFTIFSFLDYRDYSNNATCRAVVA